MLDYRNVLWPESPKVSIVLNLLQEIRKKELVLYVEK